MGVADTANSRANPVGPNDFDSTAVAAVTNLKAYVQSLITDGARYILWPNLPELELTPHALGCPDNHDMDPGFKPEVLNALAGAVSTFNTNWTSAINDLRRRNPGVMIYGLDVHSEFNKMLGGTYPGYVFSNVTGEASHATPVPASADTYLFWDGMHPTEKAHKLIGDAAYSLIAGSQSANVVAVIDTSGSMDGDKLAGAKTAATLFTQLLHQGDGVGVVNYSDYANVAYPLTVIDGAGSTQAAALAAISALYAQSNTSVGAGISAADGQLDGLGAAGSRAMILMSDGLENTSPYALDVIASQVAPDIRIFTIGFGSDADQALLARIANATGGQYYFASTQSQLQNIYSILAGVAGGQQALTNQTMTVSPGGTRTTSTLIDSSTSDVTFGINWPGSDLDLELVAPDGTVISHARSVVFSSGMENLSKWTATGTWGVSTDSPYSGAGCITDSPAGDYENGADSALTMAQPVVLPRRTDIQLSFETRYSLESGYDYGRVEISENGADWTQLGSVTGDQSTWTKQTYSLDAYAGKTIRLRLHLTSDHSVTKDGWYVDELKVTAPGTSTLPANVQLTVGNTYEFYHIQSPMPGQWQVRVQAVDVPHSDYAFNMYALADTPITGDLSLGKSSLAAGETVQVTMSLSDGTPITGADVVAHVNVPSASAITADVRLFDDGLHGDGAAGDGVYGNVFQDTYWEGQYTVTAEAHGTSDSGAAIQRSATAMFAATGALASAQPVTVAGGQGNDSITASQAGDALVVSVNGVNRVFSAAHTTALTIQGLDGNDTITVSASVTKGVTIRGGSGADRITGGSGANQIYGGAGNDTLNGGTGNDTIDGGSGTDVVYGNSGNDLIYGGDGNDRLYGQWGKDAIYGGAGTDTIYGDGGNDVLQGDDGDDLIYGGAGNDTISGKQGNDRLYGEDGNDLIYGGMGNDWIHGGKGNDTLIGGDGNDSVYGGMGNDSIEGNAGNDYLSGDSDNDTIRGGTGNDSIYGAAGNNLVYGDEGDDWIYVKNGSTATARDTVYGGAGTNRVLHDPNDLIFDGHVDLLA